MKKFLKKILFRRKRLVIYDDYFPEPISAFRYKEFIYYLENISGLTIFTAGESIKAVGSNAKKKNSLEEFYEKFPAFSKQVQPINIWSHFKAKLFYAIFLNNTYRILPLLDFYKTPFVFTLYPGGGFQLNNKESDKKLRSIFASPMFRRVIVTQKVTYDYLLKKNFCSSDKISYIFGVVAIHPKFNIKEKKQYANGKDVLDIAFCAAKYTKGGIDKGYDLFIEASKILAEKYPFIRFHVIGNFTEDDHDIGAIREITFHGTLRYEQLNSLFEKIDIIVSPNRKDKLAEGAFDGFPLGTCVQAAFNGTVVVATDVFNEKSNVFSDEEICVITPSVDNIVKTIEEFICFPDKLKRMSELSFQKFKHVYSEEVQLKTRLEILNAELKK